MWSTPFAYAICPGARLMHIELTVVETTNAAALHGAESSPAGNRGRFGKVADSWRHGQTIVN